MMMPTIYDSHTHLNDDVFYDDVPAYLARARHYGVLEMNIVGSDAKLNQRALTLAKTYAGLHAVIGWHPEEVLTATQAQLDLLAQQLAAPTVVAVGEIGLDYYWDQTHHQEQQALLASQIELANQFKLPIVVHTREALAETYEFLKAHPVMAGGVIHSFSGDWNWAKRFLALGFDLSFSGVVSFNKATELHEVAKNVPADRFLVETDAPYLTPVPYRGKQNEPGFTNFVAQAVANLRQTELVTIAELTTTNARRLFCKEVDNAKN